MSTPLPEQPHPAGQRPADDLAAAARAAVEATDNSQHLAFIAAALHAQQIAQAAQPPACQHQPARPPLPVGRYVAAAGAGAFVLLILVFSLVLATICAVSLTCCLLVLRSMWRDYQKGRAD